MMTRARNGKIARLPRFIREELNQRLADGAQARSIVAWLNEHSEVKQVMKEQFDGRPVTEDNIHEWRKGGYQEWLRQQEARDALRDMFEEAEGIRDDANDREPLDLAVVLATSALLQSLRAAGSDAEAFNKPELRQELRDISRELTQLRRAESEAELAQLKRKQWETAEEQRETAEHEKEMQDMHHHSEMYPFLAAMTISRRNDTIKMLTKNLSPEDAQNMEKFCRECWDGLPLVRNRFSRPFSHATKNGVNGTEKDSNGLCPAA